MKTYDAIGIVEALFMTTALEILDQMCKSSDVEYLASEKVLGGRLVTLIVGGSVSNVDTALAAARRVCRAKPVNPLKTAILITNPHEEIMKFIVTKPKRRKVEK